MNSRCRLDMARIGILCAWLALPAIACAQTMRLHFINVGQGAATLVEFPCAAVLIDTGGETNDQFKSTDELTKYLKSFFESRSDLHNTLASLILTHPHIDHTRGVKTVLAKFRVQNGVTDGLTTGSGRAGQNLLRKAATESIQSDDENEHMGYFEVTRDVLPARTGLTNNVIDPVRCEQQKIDPQITALWGGTKKAPANWKAAEFNNANNHSLAIRVDFGKSSFLVAGDLEDAGITDLLAKYKGTKKLQVDVYQVGHHGAKNATTDAYLKTLQPKMAVIQMGTPDRQLMWTAWAYGHPRKVAVDLLQEYVSGTRAKKSVQVATAAKVFAPESMAKGIYATGWDGALVLEADTNGNWSVVDGGKLKPVAPADDPVTPTAGLINVNKATAEELGALTGIGPGRAAKIVAYRKAHGPFATVDDLLNVPGIGNQLLDGIRDQVSVR